MAKGPISEKLQEENLIQELRDFQRSKPTNKRCFDCNEMMPQYVCLDFNTFVCTACSGIHREFAHRVKSISMSKFTESEVKNMIKRGGNEAAQKYWRSKHDPSFRPTGGTDGERTRNFIRLTYIDRKWIHGSPHRSKDEEMIRTSTKNKKEEKAGSDILLPTSSKLTKTTEFADFSNFDSSGKAPALAEQSFGDFSTFNSPAPTNASNDLAPFGDFSGTSNTAQIATTKATPFPMASKFDSFKIAPPPESNLYASSASAPFATNNLMEPRRQKSGDDLLGLDASAPAPDISCHSTSAVSSPFLAFDATAPTSQTGYLPNSAASLDPFSDMTAAAPLATAPTKQNSLLFDAFDAPPAPSSSAFDGFTVPSPSIHAGRNLFDAFGGSGDAFGAFAGSNTSTRSNSSNTALDPFARRPETPALTQAADPFAAFIGLRSSGDVTPASGSEASTFNLGTSGGFPGGHSCNQQQGVMADPFGFASGQSSSYNDMMPTQQHLHANKANNQQFGGFPAGFAQQSVPPNLYGGQMQQQPFYQGPPPQTEQRLWNGQQHGVSAPQQSMHQIGQQHKGELQARLTESVLPTPIPVKTLKSAASNNDPFASLNFGNLGFGSLNSNTAVGRTSSGGATGPAPLAPSNRTVSSQYFGNTLTVPVTSGSITNAQSIDRTTSFTHPLQNMPADPNAIGNFASASSSVQTPASPANPFDLF